MALLGAAVGAVALLGSAGPASAVTTQGPLDCVKSDLFTGYFLCSQQETTVTVEEEVLSTDVSDPVTTTVIESDDSVVETHYKWFLNTKTRTETYQTRDGVTRTVVSHDETTVVTTEEIRTTTTTTVVAVSWLQRGAGDGDGQERIELGAVTLSSDTESVDSTRVTTDLACSDPVTTVTTAWLGGWQDPFVDAKGKNK